MFELSQQFFFDAAHTLHRDVESEGSRRIHGHTYHAEVCIAGTPDSRTGMVADLGIVQKAIAALRPTLDHRLLDDVPGLGAPTLENLCVFIWSQLAPVIPNISCVIVERRASGDKCVFRPKPANLLPTGQPAEVAGELDARADAAALPKRPTPSVAS